jgi:hypothetical protein
MPGVKNGFDEFEENYNQPPKENSEEQQKQRELQDQELKTIQEIQVNVENTLGTPPNFDKVEVKRLWKNHYRANVFVKDPNKPIVDSFFVKDTASGFEYYPPITRKYNNELPNTESS